MKPRPDTPRFAFGRNWPAFLRRVDETRVRMAEDSLKDMLGLEDLSGRTFLDIGSGSGPYSLFHFPRMPAADLLRLRNPLRRYRAPRLRGMSEWHDLVDWVGGHPFETATPEDILDFHKGLDFEAVRTRLVGRRNGCNEFVFRRAGAAP